MKTLKKILSLVLVVAMIASMMIVGAAAADEKTNYEEAVAVVTGVGIIEGDENGMNYQGNVTREQAAKIISYLLLGKDTAESLKTSAAPFADVAASRWSAGYIAYLKGQGIISGVSDTEFDPTAPVTGIAFAKMLLVAAGYGANGEFEGKDWDINTITFANDNGVFTGTLAADIAAPATREEAMLYAFNLLTKVPVVKYNSTFESYYTGTSALNPVDTSEVEPSEDNVAYTYTLAWTKYELQQVYAGTDGFGRPAVSWNADGVDVADTVVNATPDAVLYGSVKNGAIYTAIGKSAAEYLNKNDAWDTVTVYTNGIPSTPISGIVKADYTNITIGQYGATVEVYVSYADGVYDVDVVVWYELVGTVNKVNATANTMTIVDTLTRDLDTTITVDGEKVDLAGYEKGDVVIYTQGNEGVASVRKAEAVVGTFINYTTFIYNIDGVSHFASIYAESTPDVYGAAYEVYYDAQGNILKVAEYESAAAYQYVYIQNSAALLAGDDLLGDDETKVVYDVVYANGGQEIVYGAVKTASDGTEYVMVNGTKTPVVTTASGEEFVPAGWYTYTTNEAGQFSIKNISLNSYATEADAIEVETGKATTGTGFSANSKTILTTIDEDGNAVTYNGIANFPEEDILNGSYPVLITHGLDSTLAKTITVYVGDTAIDPDVDYAYVVMAWSYDEETTTYMMWVDGGMQFLTFNNDNLTGLSAFTFYSVVELGVVDGEYTAELATTNMVNNMYAYYYHPLTGAQQWIETATIDDVDESFFTTVAIDAEDWDESNMKLWSDSYSMGMIAMDIPSVTYYYDADTVIYDCVNGGIVTELSAGDCFIAAVDAVETDYCEYIWIVG